MFGLKLVKKSTLETLEYIGELYNQEYKENEKFKREEKDTEELIDSLQKRLSSPNIMIFDIKKDKDDIVSYVCIVDKRSPHLDKDKNQLYFNGDLNIFVTNRYICPSDNIDTIINMPHMETTFSNESANIRELHTNLKCGSNYEGKGYGRMMIEAFIAIAKHSNCTKIFGDLSNVDAKTTEQKSKRNGFYEHMGFKVVDDENGNGYISMDIKDMFCHS